MNQTSGQLPHCGLLRRLAAILYDSLLLFGVLGVAATVPLLFTGGEALKGSNPIYTIYMFLISFSFYAWFWTHGGQTLGMRIWRIRVQNPDGTPIGLWQAMLRFLVAIASWGAFGLGFLWSLWDREKLTWHDRYSMTVLVIMPK
jgi:uncharacterized RDD family membrane protein YckC